MATFLVTVKLPRNPAHDPNNKIAGAMCPAGGDTCTDMTGQHHTVAIMAESASQIQRKLGHSIHITRIEAAEPFTIVSFKDHLDLI